MEYCENDIVKLTISSRGELATRVLYVPRKAVVHFRNRDTLNTYPLGVRLVADCFVQGASEDCRQGSKIWGVNVSKLGGAKNLLQSDFDLKFFEPTNRRHAELYLSQVSESSRVQRKWNKNDLIYTNFSPIEPADTLNFPTLYILYDSHELKRADLKRYVWHITTDEAVRTSRASHFDDLSEWKTYVSEFDALSDKISKNGEYAASCSP